MYRQPLGLPHPEQARGQPVPHEILKTRFIQ